MISELCHCSNPSTPLEESRRLLEMVASRSMGRDRDADHEVSGREGDRDANFTQPRRVLFLSGGSQNPNSTTRSSASQPRRHLLDSTTQGRGL